MPGGTHEMTATPSSSRVATIRSSTPAHDDDADHSAPLLGFPPPSTPGHSGDASPASRESKKSTTTKSETLFDADGDSDGDSEEDIVVHTSDGLRYFPPTDEGTRAGIHAAEVHLATMAQKKAMWWRSVLVTGMFILSWYTFATILSLYNKWMFSPEYYGFSYPLFVTGCHMWVQFAMAGFVRVAFKEKFKPPERPSRKDYVSRIFPTAMATGADIGLSNLSLKTITLTLYTMCKSSSLIFVLFFAFLFRLEKYSLRLVLVIGLISIGVFLMVFNVTAVSIPGLIMVFSASAVGGLRWALTELIMHKRAMGMSNPFATIFWLAPPMAVVLFAVSAGVESWSEIFHTKYFGTVLLAIKSTAIIGLPGIIAFCMVASEYFVIHRAGVVPLSVAGIFKEVSTIVFSSWVFGDKMGFTNIIGCGITIIGIALYSFHKYQKTINADVPVDALGNPVEIDETSPLRPSANSYTRAADYEHGTALGHGDDGSAALPLHEIDSARQSRRSSRPSLARMSMSSEEDPEERTTRLRDDFEGWDNVNVGDSEYEDESDVDDESIARLRGARMGGGFKIRWAEWWDRSV